jgi:23S rRNA (cytidine1920-2'-O)/16S rRNA (cytidine1409-2'-O)-methyltransferase
VARRRLDAELVRRGLATSRTEAQAAVRDGLVLVGGRAAGKPSTLVDPADPVELVGPARRFVSRGGEKLDAALDGFSIEVAGRRALDAGASTGGFTDCLLQRGAAHVIAVDVGYGQLAWSLRRDPRVTVLERTNVRDLLPDALPFAPEIVVADLSFISLRLAVGALAGVASEGAQLVLLVKPQFEAGRDAVGPGGVVRDPEGWADAIRGVAEAAAGAGLPPLGVMASPVRGPAGNVEFLLHASKTAGTGSEIDVDAAVASGLEIAGRA